MPGLKTAHWFARMFRDMKNQWVFLANLVAALGLCVSGLAAFVEWNNRTKLIIHPIEEVIQINNLPQSTDVARPISEIRPQRDRGPQFWHGYEVSLVDFCESTKGGFSDAYSDAFQKGTWKILVPGEEQSESVIANTNLTMETCKKVEKWKANFEQVNLVFDSKIPGITNDKAEQYFVSGSRLSAPKWIGSTAVKPLN
jgi:hypothetical protein